MEESVNKKEDLTEKKLIQNPDKDDKNKVDETTQNDSRQDIKSDDNDGSYNSTDNPPSDDLNPEVELKKMHDKFNELNDKYLRLYSDFENYRKRIQKEKTDWMKYAGEDVIKHILPVLDDFERAIKHNQNLEDVEKLREGFVLIFNKLKQLLKQKGLEPVESKGEPFNADFMEAVTQIPAPDDQSKGMVIDELEKGYKMHEKIIRLAKVVVGS